MRKHLSVLALWARQTIGKVLALLAVMAAAETAFFAWAMSQGLTRVIMDDETCPAPVEDLLDFAKIGWVYRIAMALLFTLLLLHILVPCVENALASLPDTSFVVKQLKGLLLSIKR